MDMYQKYTSPFGYQTGTGGIDTYGVNHNGFSLRDEIEYQFARQKRENELQAQYNAQGVTENYPQYTTNFWGNSDNNYGFGMTNITDNINNVLSPLTNNLNNGVQYAQNNLPGVANDATHNPNYISDNDLYQRMWGNIKKYENVKYHPYLDSKGYITTGGGANINNLNDFLKVNFTVNGYPATDTQKLIGYNKLRDLSNQKDIYGNYLNRNRTADSFLDKTNLNISEQDAYNMAQNHMKNDLAHVRSEFTDFDYFPNQLKEVLLDIQYNTGGLNKQNWPKLYNAINNRDVNGIADNVHRKDVGWERNDWAEQMARSIRF